MPEGTRAAGEGRQWQAQPGELRKSGQAAVQIQAKLLQDGLCYQI